MFATMNRHETFRVDAGALRAARRRAASQEFVLAAKDTE
jgi:hypothetical protein